MIRVIVCANRKDKRMIRVVVCGNLRIVGKCHRQMQKEILGLVAHRAPCTVDSLYTVDIVNIVHCGHCTLWILCTVNIVHCVDIVHSVYGTLCEHYTVWTVHCVNSTQPLASLAAGCAPGQCWLLGLVRDQRSIQLALKKKEEFFQWKIFI